MPGQFDFSLESLAGCQLTNHIHRQGIILGKLGKRFLQLGRGPLQGRNPVIAIGGITDSLVPVGSPQLVTHIVLQGNQVVGSQHGSLSATGCQGNKRCQFSIQLLKLPDSSSQILLGRLHCDCPVRCNLRFKPL